MIVISKLSDLRSLFAACREEGVMSFQSPEVSFVLGPKPVAVTNADGTAKVETDEERTERELFGGP